MKVFNYLNGVFYILYGLFGAFIPLKMAVIMGWQLSLLGLHQMRAICVVMAALGVMAIMYAGKLTDQKPLTLAFIFVTLGFATGRLLGLAIDGTGPTQTYGEIGFEVIWAGIGVFLYKRS